MTSDCLFCKIVAGTIGTERVYEDDWCLAFRDINPQAPTHVLVVPKEHLASHAQALEAETELVGRVFAAAGVIARQENLTNGYRVVMNTGPDGGQTVDHLHAHLLGGRAMRWPPG